jgi:hypothetical protein
MSVAAFRAQNNAHTAMTESANFRSNGTGFAGNDFQVGAG